MLASSFPPRVGLWGGRGLHAGADIFLQLCFRCRVFRILHLFLATGQFSLILPPPSPSFMAWQVCGKYFSFHQFLVWWCLVVAAHRVIMVHTLHVQLCLFRGSTFFRPHFPSSSIVDGFKSGLPAEQYNVNIILYKHTYRHIDHCNECVVFLLWIGSIFQMWELKRDTTLKIW